MIMKELSVDNADVINPIDVDIDDEGVLADGMIPDSRIVKLIDELEFASDDFDNDGDLVILCSHHGGTVLINQGDKRFN